MTPESPASSGPLAAFVTAPWRLQTWSNLLYLALSFPLGLAYFLFLVIGLSLGFSLTIVWVGLPILALVLAGSWGFAALERQLAIRLLRAEVPPMAPRAAVSGTAPSLWQRLKDTLANPVTWKGMSFLAVKFPLGLVTFVALVTLLSVSVAFLAIPFVYQWEPPQIFVWEDSAWVVDTLGEALACSVFGLGLLWASLNLLNLLAAGWQWISRLLLGSPRFAVSATA